MKIFSTLLLFLSVSVISKAQTTVTLTTNDAGYKDAVIRDLSPTTNYGSSNEIV